MSYDKTNTGIVSKNDRKTQDTHPDITGSINIEGVEYFLDGWRKERNDGNGTFYSLKAKKKDKQGGGAQSGSDRPQAAAQQGGKGGAQSGSYAAQSGAGGSLRGDPTDDDLPF